MSPYSTLMSIHKFLAILIAVAVLIAPAFTSAGMAFAAAPDHHAQMTDKGHCDSAGGEDRDQPADKACCGAMCMALAVTPAAAPLAKPLVGNVPVAGVHSFRTGTPAELATPPPRVA